MKCPRCGTTHPKDAPICTVCHTPFSAAADPANNKTTDFNGRAPAIKRRAPDTPSGGPVPDKRSPAPPSPRNNRVRCFQCGADNPGAARLCAHCGIPLNLKDSRQTRKTETHVTPEKTDEHAGRLISNRYEIVKKIGEGGMGQVYKVRDLMLDDKTIALKMMRPELMDNAAARRLFHTEVMLTRELAHDNIVKVYHLDESEGRHYFTMAHLDGETLRERIRKRIRVHRTFFLEEAAAVIAPVLEALEYAHSRGVIHRDLKPENIMIQGKFPDIDVKVLDFGFATVMTDSQLSQSAAALGTVYYIAPEQLAGTGNVDLRSDLFSVGVILYELLTGDVPTGYFELPGAIIPGVPKRADVVIEKALATDPEDRYENARAFLEHLRSANKKEPPSIRPVRGGNVEQYHEAAFNQYCQRAIEAMAQADFAQARSALAEAKDLFSNHERIAVLKDKMRQMQTAYDAVMDKVQTFISQGLFESARQALKDARRICPYSAAIDGLMRQIHGLDPSYDKKRHHRNPRHPDLNIALTSGNGRRLGLIVGIPVFIGIAGLTFYLIFL